MNGVDAVYVVKGYRVACFGCKVCMKWLYGVIVCMGWMLSVEGVCDARKDMVCV